METHRSRLASQADQLRQFIADETERLLRACHVYVVRMGLATGESAETAAVELLNEVVVEALEHADRFDPSRQVMAWLLGIAINLIRRKQATLLRLDQREPLARDLYPGLDDALSEDELFDRLAALAASAAEPLQDVEANALLAAASPDDRHVLKLAIWGGLDGESLARELGISAGAARVRLHRALRRLRATLEDEHAPH